MARGTRLREILKQPQNSPLSVSEQVAIIYTGINGFLDDLALSDVKEYCVNLLSYLKVSKPKYIEEIETTTLFTETAETLLKEAISETKESFLK